MTGSADAGRSELAALFTDGQSEPSGPPVDLLVQCLEQARSEHPSIELPDALFVPYLAARLPPGQADEGLSTLEVADLFLACACVLGVPEALRRFEQVVLEPVRRKIERMVGEHDEAADLVQKIRARLLVGDEQTPPRLASYGGRGTLVAWAKVVAVREALMHRRRARPEQGGQELLDQAVGLDLDPELELMRQRYREAFRTAFSQALCTLSAQDRNVLRHHVLDRLGIDQIGALMGVHRSTAARWLVRIRAHLREQALLGLRRELEVSAPELDSIVRLVRSQLEVSLRGLL